MEVRRKKSAGRGSATAHEDDQRGPTGLGKQHKGPPRTAILVANGFDRKGRWGGYNEQEALEFPWIDLCVKQIKKHSRRSSYEILVWDNTRLKEHRRLLRRQPRVRLFGPGKSGTELRHAQSLNRLVAKVHPETEFIITLDTDAFPIRNGWIDNLIGRLNDDVLLAGVWRDELAPRKPAYIHPCCLAVRVETLRKLGTGFAIGEGRDVGHLLTLAAEEAGGRTSRLYRSNRWDPHYLMGALYGDLIYHQGAGSRAPKFSGDSRKDDAELIRTALRNAAFTDLERMLDALAGNLPPAEVPALAELAARQASARGAAQGTSQE